MAINLKSSAKNTTADVCIITEGTYPYTVGGVSSWIHDLITMHPDLSFHVVALIAPDTQVDQPKFTIPDNVLRVHPIYLHQLPESRAVLTQQRQEQFFSELQPLILALITAPTRKVFQSLLNLFSQFEHTPGEAILLDSKPAWDLFLAIYQALAPQTNFLQFYWSFRNLLVSFYSVLLQPLPPAKLYHAIATGYSGIQLIRAKLTKRKPCLLTEHGIYTNERQMEVAVAKWLDKNTEDALALKTLWNRCFSAYGKVCYGICDKIVTLYNGNRIQQIYDGANPEKLMIIPNGVNLETYGTIPRDTDHPPTIALIGRVVPIKDVKSYIHTVKLLQTKVHNLIAYVIGPMDEDPDYAKECQALVASYQLEKTLCFTGSVDIKKHLGKIDIIVLSSISEVQPLVMLEGGASGVLSVTTHVGGCYEIVHGTTAEDQALGLAGAVCPILDPEASANALYELINDEKKYQQQSQTIKKRVQKYYSVEQCYGAYRKLYEGYIRKQRRTATHQQ